MSFCVVVVGGGPCGLFLCCRLSQLCPDVSVLLIERDVKRAQTSRSVGILPPTLELLDAAGGGLVDRVLDAGVKITRGAVYERGHQDPLAELDLTMCGGKFPFAVAVPQCVTESILEEYLVQEARCSLVAAAELRDMVDTGTVRKGVTIAKGIRFRAMTQQRGKGVMVDLIHSATGLEITVLANILVGADGGNSDVRKQCGIRWPGQQLKDLFLMGDVAASSEHDALGDAMQIMMTPEGLVESFPLPGGVRRWVCTLEEEDVATFDHDRRALKDDLAPAIARLRSLVDRRTGYDIGDSMCHWVSYFAVHSYVADAFHYRRVALCGDAAHVICPIGGQGMNLGLDDAFELATVLCRLWEERMESDEKISSAFEQYSKQQRVKAISIDRRAVMNITMGRRQGFPPARWMRRVLIKGIASWCYPIRWLFSRYFTMRFVGVTVLGVVVL